MARKFGRFLRFFGRNGVRSNLHNPEVKHEQSKKQRGGACIAADPRENSQSCNCRNFNPADPSKTQPYVAQCHEEQVGAEIRRIYKAKGHPCTIIMRLLVVGQILNSPGKRQDNGGKRDSGGDGQVDRQNLPEFHPMREKNQHGQFIDERIGIRMPRQQKTSGQKSGKNFLSRRPEITRGSLPHHHHESNQLKDALHAPAPPVHLNHGCR